MYTSFLESEIINSTQKYPGLVEEPHYNKTFRV